jgi:choline/glycine/proline betaine transport protein
VVICLFFIVIVVIFFTTSSDSASLVVDMLCSGTADSPTRQRVFWGITEGVVAATVLTASGVGGLDALQQTIIVFGLPFFVIGFFMMAALVKSLHADAAEGSGAQRQRKAPLEARSRKMRREQQPESGGGSSGTESGTGLNGRPGDDSQA